jgi:protein-S-isoprenylcysteine O-methyltransferase Ste14
LEASGGIDRSGAVSDGETAGIAIPPPLIYVAGFLLGVALELAFPISGLPPALAALAAFAGVALWLALDGSAMMLFRRARTSMAQMEPATALVTSGPYRITRNPMYLGMAFLYAGLALSLGMIWSLALLPLVLVVVDRLLITREERYLEARFGERYRDYRRRVRRWL